MVNRLQGFQSHYRLSTGHPILSVEWTEWYMALIHVYLNKSDGMFFFFFMSITFSIVVVTVRLWLSKIFF